MCSRGPCAVRHELSSIDSLRSPAARVSRSLGGRLVCHVARIGVGAVDYRYRLGALDPGARIEIGGNGEPVHEYMVVERTMYDKDSLPADLWRKTGPETLVLITCGGRFNQATRRYEQNIVVYAHPVEGTNTPLPT
jgi:hypothetical protein